MGAAILCLASGSVVPWTRPEVCGEYIKYKDESTIFCPSLIKNQSTWLHSVEIRSEAAKYIFCTSTDGTAESNLWIEIFAYSGWLKYLQIFLVSEVFAHSPADCNICIFSWWVKYLHIFLVSEIFTHFPGEWNICIFSWWVKYFHTFLVSEIFAHFLGEWNVYTHFPADWNISIFSCWVKYLHISLQREIFAHLPADWNICTFSCRVKYLHIFMLIEIFSCWLKYLHIFMLIEIFAHSTIWKRSTNEQMNRDPRQRQKILMMMRTTTCMKVIRWQDQILGLASVDLRGAQRRTSFSLSDLRWKPISLPRDESQCNCVCAPACAVAIITLCVCVWFFCLLSLFVTLYIFLHLTAMYSSTFGKGWVGRSCLYFLVRVSFGTFCLWELTCVHCVYMALWTRKVLCGSFFMRYI